MDVIDILSDNVTSNVASAFGESHEMHEDCFLCGRSPDRFDHKGYTHNKSKYCPSCFSFIVSDLDEMGYNSAEASMRVRMVDSNSGLVLAHNPSSNKLIAFLTNGNIEKENVLSAALVSSLKEGDVEFLGVFEAIGEKPLVIVAQRLLSDFKWNQADFYVGGNNLLPLSFLSLQEQASYIYSKKDLTTLSKDSSLGLAQTWRNLGGIGCVIEASTGRVVIFAAEGVMVKLPPKFFERFKDIRVMSSYQQVVEIAKEDWQYPILWVSSFGRKYSNLVRNLKLSHSKRSVYEVTDEKANSTTDLYHYLDLEAYKNFIKQVEAMEDKKKLKALLIKITRLSNGSMTPNDMFVYFKKEEDPRLLTFYRDLPVDPFKRLLICGFVKKYFGF